MLVVHDRLFVFANNVPLVVLFDSMPGLWLSGFRIVNGNDLLRRTRLAARVNAGGLHWTENAARSSAAIRP